LGQSLGFTLDEIKPLVGISAKVDHQHALSLLRQKQQHTKILIAELTQKQQAIDKLVSMLTEHKVGDGCIAPEQITAVLIDSPYKI
jgi:DNA-binding transcriptional MerR regulator